MKMIINGKHTAAADGKELQVLNPATLEVVDTVPAAALSDIDEALCAATEGFQSWKRVALYKRIEKIRAFTGLMQAHIDELAKIMCAEGGKTINDCYGEIAACIGVFEAYCDAAKHFGGLTLPVNSEPRVDGDLILTLKEPLGVVAAIIPFNYPLELYAHKVAPALLTGNTVVVKPASDTPLSAIYATDLMHQAGVPGNVIQVITGSGAMIGDYLSKSEKIAAVSLTGSVGTGIATMTNGARNLTRVFLELGGNDPIIIFDDADLDQAVAETLGGRASNAGQTCCGTKRMLVQNGIKEAYTEKLIEALKKLKVGDPTQTDTDYGPLINERAAILVEEQVQHTVDQGATLALGGKRFNRTFFEPTVLTNVTPDMDVASHLEIFGPVFPVIGFDTAEEAIGIANSCPYGLAAGVLTRDFSVALKVATELQCGTCVINGSGNYRSAQLAFGGYKLTGLGREGTTETLAEYTQTKNIALKKMLV